jgi:hypothetical protein
MVGETNRSRRWAVTALLVLTTSSGLAWAGSYLNRAVVLIRHAREEGEYLRARLSDVELARILHQVAEGRLRAARGMLVPKEVEQAHPHLMQMLEHYERAASAAANGKPGRFAELLGQARDEEQIFRSILRQLGWPLPDER